MISFGFRRSLRPFIFSSTVRAAVYSARVIPSFQQAFALRAFSVDPRSEEAAKEAAQQFMQAAKDESFITEVNSYEDWRPMVMEEKNKPIILDCYADWCQPCKKLMPVLEELALSHEGKFKLVKLNIDNLPQLAQGLNVKSIPALFLIYRGNIMDTVVGVNQVRLNELVQTALLIEQTTHDESLMVKVLEEAKKLIEKKDYAQAELILRDGLTYEMWRDKFGAQFTVGIAHCHLLQFADPAKAREILAPLTEAQVQAMDPDSYWTELVFKVDEEIQRLEQLAMPDEAEFSAKAAIESDPSNLDNYNTLATILIEKNRHEEAIPVLLDILTINRNWKKEGDKKPQEKLIEVFAKLGQTNETVKLGKKRLAKILF